MPKTIFLEMGEGIGKETIVPSYKRLQSQNDLGERRKNQQREQETKAPGRKPIKGAVFGVAHEFATTILFMK